MLTFANGLKTRREIIAIDYLLFIHKVNKYVLHFLVWSLRLNIFCLASVWCTNLNMEFIKVLGVAFTVTSQKSMFSHNYYSELFLP